MGINIEMLGAWDTVERIGNPLMVKLQKVLHSVNTNWYDIKKHENINNMYHALAIDEKRFAFLPTLVDEANFINESKKIMQVWFAGCHSNIGGGYKNNKLSNNVLIWMIKQAINHGLQIDSSLLSKFSADAEKGTLRDETMGFCGFVYFSSKIFKLFVPIRKIAELTKERNAIIRIAESVFLRKENDQTYTPLGLPVRQDCVIEDDTIKG